jgi:hypothetical protein
MSNELEWQRRIVKSVKSQGGWGAKWATQWTVGVPDLVLCLPDHGLFTMEVKLFKDLKPAWSRQVGTTEKQKHALSSINAAGGLGLVGAVIKYAGTSKTELVAIHPSTEVLSETSMAMRPYVEWSNKSFDVNQLIHQYRGMTYDGG